MAPTKLQQIARDENYAIFQLKGMISNLTQVRNVQDEYIQKVVKNLNADLHYLVTLIQCKQSDRKREAKIAKDKAKENKSHG